MSSLADIQFQTNQASLAMEEPRTSDGERDPIPIDTCRRLLADEAEGLSDEDIDRLRRHAASLAHVLIEIALEHESQG